MSNKHWWFTLAAMGTLACQQPAVAQAAALSTPAAKVAPGQLPSLADLVASVKGAVVNVEVKERTTMNVPSADLFGPDQLFKQFFGQQRGPHGQPFEELQQRELIRQGAGSGVVIDPKGLVLTNNHVVDGATAITVTFDDGRKFDAKVLGHDPLTDLALVQLEGNFGGLQAAKLGDSDATRVGDWVVAIGNPYGLNTSVSAGILSARARDIQAGPYDDFLQTDAAINPGNSGGPLFNLEGEVVGINTAIIGGGSGIGFAVPSNMVKRMLPQLESGKPIERGWLGVMIQDLTPQLAQALHVPVNQGAVVGDVNTGGPAASAGLKEDDVVTAVDGSPVKGSKGLTRAIGFHAPNTTTQLTVYRDGKPLQLQVKLGTRPDLEGYGQRETGSSSQAEQMDQLGLKVQDGPAAGQGPGASIAFVDPGSPAEKADLRPGMLVVEAGGKPVKSTADFLAAVHAAKKGDTLLLKIEVQGGHLLRALTVP